MIKYCIFDLDGTLLNTIDTIAYYVNNALQKYGIPPISIEEAKQFVGDGAEKLILRSLEAKAPTRLSLLDGVLTEYKEAYDTEPLYLTEAYEGILKLIRELKERKIALAVLSNKPHSALCAVVSHYFGDSFTVVQGALPGVSLKPDPAPLLSVIGRIDATAGEVMYIGDTGVDMKTGKNAGVALTVGVSWGFRDRAELWECGADRVVDTPREISELCV